MTDHLVQTVDIETPELVVVSYTIAGLGSRVYAAMIDLVICVAMYLGLIFGILILTSGARGVDARIEAESTVWAIAVIFLLLFAILWGYYLLFEGLRDGQTPGKRMLGLRAVRDGGYSVGFSASAVRNLMRIVDMQPAFSYFVGIGSITISKSGKRLGDMVAGTLVVREALVRQPVAPRAPAARAGAASDAAPATPTAQLTEGEFALLERWSERRSSLEPEKRRQLTAQVAERLRRALPA
ncbi:MAG: RDD family protein [Gemmatimonadaceae bacterium]